jgi:hypothetical protein
VFAWVLRWAALGCAGLAPTLTRHPQNKISRVLGCKIGLDLEGALAALGSFSGVAVENAN